MKLVGATDAFVAAPFLIEGLLQGARRRGARRVALLAVHAAVVPRLGAALARRGSASRDTLLPRCSSSRSCSPARGARAPRERARGRRARCASRDAARRRARPRARPRRRTRGRELAALGRAGAARAGGGAPRSRKQERSVLDTLERGAARARGARAEQARRAPRRSAPRAEAALARARRRRVAARRAARRAWLAELRPRLARARADGARSAGCGSCSRAGSLAELAQRRYLLDRILARDAALLREARRDARRARGGARRAQEREASRVDALAAEAARRRAEAAARREERETLLAALRGARGFHERAARGGGGAGAQARGVRRDALAPPPRGARPADGGFAALRGRLAAPRRGPIVAGFGRIVNPQLQHRDGPARGRHRARRAGAPVRAVAPGRVVHAGWFRGYGNLVIVDHGDGYHTLVAHLASMRTAMGEEVDAGTVLGTVGDSGVAQGRGRLYFEIRERRAPGRPARLGSPRRAAISSHAMRRSVVPARRLAVVAALSRWRSSPGLAADHVARAARRRRSRTARSTSSPRCSRTSRTSTSRTSASRSSSTAPSTG